MPSLTFDDVSIDYVTQSDSGRTEIAAVKKVSLVLPEGGTLGIAGESGSGKSTLAMSVLRLLPHNAKTRGRILLDDRDIACLSWGKLRAVRWGEAAVVFQGAMHSLNPVERVGKQVLEALELHVKDTYSSAKLRQQRLLDLFAQVDLPADKATAYPHQLSGGQKQRVMIAMALACDPALIIADEPTTALDVIVQAQVLKVMSDLVRDRGISLLMISHDLSVLGSVCERIAVMYKGEIVEVGPSAEVIEKPKHPHTRALAAAFPTIGDHASRLHPVSRRNTEAIDVVTEEVTRRHAGDVMISARKLSVGFHGRLGTFKAIDEVDVDCREGEIIALVGQSGSGKTTFARTLLGLQRADSGEVLFHGSALPRSPKGLKEYRRLVQLVPQDPAGALNPKHSVYDSVAEGIRIHSLPGNEREQVTRALDMAELTPPEKFFHAIPQELSGGQCQRVVIAGALALSPRFLVADEPVASLDASARGEILALLLRLKNEFGLGALVITHDLGLAWNIADRVLVMNRGKIVEQGPVEEVLLNPQHAYTRRLLSAVPVAQKG